MKFNLRGLLSKISKITERLPKSLAILTLAFTVIFTSFGIRDIIEHDEMPPNASGEVSSNGFWQKDVLLPAVTSFRKESGVPIKGYSAPTPSTIGLQINKVSFIDDEQATAYAYGKLLVEWDDQSIQDYEGAQNQLEQSAKTNLMSALSINFASEEERMLKLLWRSSFPANNGVKSYRESYAFKGIFKIIHDFRKFPFDIATLNIKFSTPIQAPDILLESDLDYTDNSDPDWRINSYFYNKQDCGYSKEWKLDKNLYGPQWLCAYDIFETQSEEGDLVADFIAGKKLNSADAGNILRLNPAIVFRTQFKRATGSSFYRYIAPIAFVLLVASMFDRLGNDAWEVKIAIPPTILLTLIFMHSSFRSEIPQISYITFMDRLYFLAYAGCILLLLSTILSRNIRGEPDGSTVAQASDSRGLSHATKSRLTTIIRLSFVFTVTIAPFIAFYMS
ncbi:hypothetical protein KBY83_12550 [Cyanobium sp. WKJ7-Wakatipu]|uniref:hypothetical protein n=1 Tax=Cyanobium sp. WKJ7-Wakatipu TaxID=2823726 RepID=UPI0020CE5E6A|nr:hypothetical protein [Cyanobium sp. WKJ7-Wakatipu]MCP9784131.1 hypothetical protein [Cyanobium sp. WKJ7-Wakatipu]